MLNKKWANRSPCRNPLEAPNSLVELLFTQTKILLLTKHPLIHLSWNANLDLQHVKQEFPNHRIVYFFIIDFNQRAILFFIFLLLAPPHLPQKYYATNIFIPRINYVFDKWHLPKLF